MFEISDQRGLLGDELAQRRQSGYAVDDGLAARIREATTGDGASDEEVGRLYQQLEATELRPDWEYEEPTGLADIIAASPSAPAARPAPAPDELNDRILAAWLGRCAGCNLGKPVEGWDSRARTRQYLEAAGAFPLDDYVPVADPMPDGFTFHGSWPGAVRGRVDGMARDDDLDYTMLGLRILETYGRGYTSADVAAEWLLGMPYHAVYTAERIAYGNLVTGLTPPRTAVEHNPYREWIGAQIRADIHGYVSPGDPAAAARQAYQDAALSHTANGIYGEMWAAALIAAALTASTAREALDQAIEVVPARSRLRASLQAVIAASDAGRSWEQAMEDIERRLPGYHWVHTVNNAEVVAAALLWGEGDFSRSIGLAVEAGLDTDSDGATVGSAFGALHGTAAIPAHWTDPLHDTMHSALFGFDGVSISSLARRTIALTGSQPEK